MNINFHGTEMVAPIHGELLEAVELKDRAGNRLNLFFDSPEALEALRDALTDMVIEADTARGKA